MATSTVSIPKTTFVSSAQPSGNFSYYPLLFAGTDVNFQECIGLLQIDLPVLPVTQVESAILHLALVAKSGTDPSLVVVNRVDVPYNNETVTYNTRPVYTESTQISVTNAELYTNVQIDITALVNDWLTGVYANNGIALTNTDGTSLVEFGTNAIVYEPYFPKLVLTYGGVPEEGSALNFSYAQLAHIIQQIIMFYPTNTVTVFTKGLTASSVTGTPHQLFVSPEGTSGGLFIVMDNGQQQAIPLTSITAIYTGDGTVYSPAFSYLTPTDFPSGYDKDYITAVHDYLPIGTNVDMYTGSNVHATGTVYKNEYGMLVLSDGSGNTPVFVPVNPITAVLPTFQQSAGTQEAKLPSVVAEK